MTRSLRNQVIDTLTQNGLAPAFVKVQANGLMSLRFAVAGETASQRLFDSSRKLAWRVLDALPLSKVEDYFEVWVEGQNYHNILIHPVVEEPIVAEPIVEPTVVEQAEAVVEAAFQAGEKVWVAVRYQGKAMRITGEVLAGGQLVKVRSTRTGQEYDVPATLVFESRPDVSVLDLVA